MKWFQLSQLIKFWWKWNDVYMCWNMNLKIINLVNLFFTISTKWYICVWKFGLVLWEKEWKSFEMVNKHDSLFHKIISNLQNATKHSPSKSTPLSRTPLTKYIFFTSFAISLCDSSLYCQKAENIEFSNSYL